jgi:hypothetical protein
MKRLIFPAVMLAAIATETVRGEIVFDGGPISENFDSLGTAVVTNVFSPTIGVQSAVPGTSGFEATQLAGTSTATSSLILNDGTVGTGGVQNFGMTDASDRALGLVASNFRSMAIGFALRNNVEGTIVTSITITFNQENWRTPTTAVNTLTAAWATSASAGVTASNYLTAAGMTALPALTMTLAPTPSNTALDGNLLANQFVKTHTFSSLNLAFGDRLFLRWTDVNDPGGDTNDAGIGMDNMMLTLTTTVVPEAPAYALGAIASIIAGAMCAWRALRRNSASDAIP